MLLPALGDEKRAGAVGRHDAEAAEGVRDEPDEAARGEHARRGGRHVRLEVLQGAHLRGDHAAEGQRALGVEPLVVQR